MPMLARPLEMMQPLGQHAEKLRATQILLGLIRDIERRSEANPSQPDAFCAEDEQVLKLLKARLAGPNTGDYNGRH